MSSERFDIKAIEDLLDEVGVWEISWEDTERDWLPGRYILEDTGPFNFGMDGEEGIYADREIDLIFFNKAPEIIRFLIDRLRGCGMGGVKKLKSESIQAADVGEEGDNAILRSCESCSNFMVKEPAPVTTRYNPFEIKYDELKKAVRDFIDKMDRCGEAGFGALRSAVENAGDGLPEYPAHKDHELRYVEALQLDLQKHNELKKAAREVVDWSRVDNREGMPGYWVPGKYFEALKDRLGIN